MESVAPIVMYHKIFIETNKIPPLEFWSLLRELKGCRSLFYETICFESCLCLLNSPVASAVNFIYLHFYGDDKPAPNSNAVKEIFQAMSDWCFNSTGNPIREMEVEIPARPAELWDFWAKMKEVKTFKSF